ncbi:MAG TPA: preprotein translocase subunit SecE [Candidatus Paceibacterota bacterium]|nr:preprotein translocase subunit SecE [Candidatus Paceibacterota bacterium]
MGFVQYLKDTRGELRHVAWPTRVQTIVFTALVIIVSILTSLYLGFFDYIFTTGLGEVVELFPGSSNAPFEIQDIETEPVAPTTPDIDTLVPDAE